MNDTLLTLRDPRLFYLFRNGYGETHQALENSILAYIAEEQIHIKEAASQTYAFFLPFVLVISIACVLTLVHLCRIQEKVNILSSLLMSYHIPTYIEQRRVIIDRLANLHGEELPNQSEGLIGNHKPMRLYNACGLGSVLVLCILGFSFLCYALEYFFIVQNMSDAMTTWPYTIGISSDWMSNIVQLWSWLLEIIVYDIPMLSITSLPGYSYLTSPIQEFMKVYEQSQPYIHTLRVIDIAKDSKMSLAHFSFAYDHIASSCVYLEDGFYTGMINIHEDSKYLADQVIRARTDQSTNNLYACSRVVVSLASTLLNDNIQDVEGEINYWVQLLICIVCLHSLLILGGLGVGFYWTVQNTKRQVQAMWKTLSLFPVEAGEASQAKPL